MSASKAGFHTMQGTLISIATDEHWTGDISQKIKGEKDIKVIKTQIETKYSHYLHMLNYAWNVPENKLNYYK